MEENLYISEDIDRPLAAIPYGFFVLEISCSNNECVFSVFFAKAFSLSSKNRVLGRAKRSVRLDNYNYNIRVVRLLLDVGCVLFG